MELKGKKLLILGGTSASYDLVRNAQRMGIYTIVTDNNQSGVSKAIADETAMVSTADIPALVALAKELDVDGIFCGPSEFNLRNAIQAAAAAELPCYTTIDVWNRCANKDTFKAYCRQFGVDCTPEYPITLDSTEEELRQLPYPIIVKPVDGCSSAGITVCSSAAEVRPALEKAYAASKSKKIIAEKYIENSGEIFSVRYLLRDGEAYPYFLMDTYVVDPIHRTSLISGYTHAPSKYAAYYMTHMDASVRRMLKGMGLTNGTAFIQALPYEGKIYFHEMGYRLSGGMLFKLTEPLTDINDMQIMLRYAAGGGGLTDEEIRRIDLNCKGKYGCQLMFPLSVGTIGRIEGVEAVKQHPAVCDFIQYYHEGDEIGQQAMGTLGQHFCRITFIVDSAAEEMEAIRYFQKTLAVYDVDGNKMTQFTFDVDRLH